MEGGERAISPFLGPGHWHWEGLAHLVWSQISPQRRKWFLSPRESGDSTYPKPVLQQRRRRARVSQPVTLRELPRNPGHNAVSDLEAESETRHL